MERMTQEEFQDYLADMAKRLDEDLITQREYDDAVKDATVGLKGYTEQKRRATAQLINSLGKLTTSIMDGEEGASVYNQSINAGADAVASFASKFGILGMVFGFLIKAATKYVTAVNEQADTLFKSYREISRNGLALGMDQTFQNLQKLGYTTKEIGQYGELLKNNSTILAQMGGTVSRGTDQFAKIGHDIQFSNMGYQFRLMGMDTDAINKGTANYLQSLQLSGGLNRLSATQMRQGAEEYILQQDKITKLTGASADQQQQIYETAMANERFAARQYELKAKADAGDAHAKAEYERNKTLNAYISATRGPQFAAAFQNMAAGYLNGPGAAQLANIAGGFTDDVMSGVTDVNRLVKRLAEGQQESKATVIAAGKYGSQIGPSTVEFIKGMNSSKKELEGHIMDHVEAEQRSQRAGEDAATDSMVKLTMDQRNIALASQKLINKGIVPVTKGMEVASDVLDKGTDIIKEVTGDTSPKLGGGSETSSPPSAPSMPPPNQSQEKNLSAVTSAAKTAGITDTSALRALQAVILKESGGKTVTENLDYSKTDNSRIRSIFGSRVSKYTDAQLNALKASPEKFAEAIYGKDSGMKLGNTEPGDGWKYRGRGFVQLTGKSLYYQASQAIFHDDRLVKNPDMVNDPDVAAQVAVWYMSRSGSFTNALKSGKMSQEQWNRVVTSAVAGQDVGNMGKIGQENLAKVNAYEKSLPKAATGGVLTGPKSGYQTMLHGTEAVVPLPDGRSIPVEMKNSTGSSPEQLSLLHEEVEKLDNLVRIMISQNDLAKKMLYRLK